MNILFVTSHEPSLINGGVEHVTIQVAQCLAQNYGHHCFSLYNHCVDTITNDIFEDFQLLPTNNQQYFFEKYLEQHAIDVVVAQNLPGVLPVIRNVARPVKLIYAHHSDPFYNIKTFNLDFLLFKSKYGSWSQKCSIAKIFLLFPFYKAYIRYSLKKVLRSCVENADKVVVLSENAIKPFSRLAQWDNTSKITFINNPLSFEKSITWQELANKQKKIIMVCRMEEMSKKVSLALKIWKKISQVPQVSEWTLQIIGDGPDLETYRKIVSREGLKNVCFSGKKDPYDDFRQASVFFMTSISEGWGIATTEAMQMGCVPIAFDGYPAIYDIIENGENGFLVEYRDIDGFSEMALKVMLDDHLRNEMARKAVVASQRFDMKTVGQKWESLITSL